MLRKSGMTIFLVWCSATWALSAEPSGQILGGSLDSPVKIEVFSDFQCPACRTLFLDTIRPVLKNYKDKVCVVYYEYPLPAHQYALPAARYIAAAARLGNKKMPQLFEEIFKDQDEWSRNGDIEASIARVLSQEELLKVKQIMQDADIDADINSEITLGERKGVDSTPTLFFYYQGKERKAPGFYTYTNMKQFLDTVLK